MAAKRTFSLASDATVSTESFGCSVGNQLTIHLDTAATSTPTGVFTLEIYKEAGGAWEVVTAASAELANGNPAAAAAAYVANFENPPQGKLQMTYTATSLGSATVGSITIVVDHAKK
jgi:hypothetical protein